MILIRSTLFNILLFGSVLVLSPLTLSLPHASPRRLLGFVQGWARFVLGCARWVCGIRLEVTGLENLPPDMPVLIAAQHQSAYDTLVWLTLLPRPAYVLKKELLKLPMFGPAVLPSGMIAVDRAGGVAAMRALIDDARKAVAAGRQIIIFPEGTRVAPGARGTLQPGIVALARALGVPVIPAATNSGLFWGRNAYFKRPGRLRIRIDPALPSDMPRDRILAALAAKFYDEPVDNPVKSAAGNLGTEVNVAD